MIPAEHKHNVITTGIDFMRSITLAFGTDVGLQLWDTISSTLDPSVKGDIFFALLTGASTDDITVHSCTSTKVSLIKAIREVTGMGLKEAKDKADIVMPTGVWDYVTQRIVPQAGTSQPITLTPTGHNSRATAMQILRNAGCSMSD